MKEKKKNKRKKLLGIFFLLFILLIILKRENAQKNTVEEIKTVSLLISTNGDDLRKELINREIEKFQSLNSNYHIVPTFVESDTLVFLKLLYSNGKNGYDIAGLGEESMVSAAEQGLVYPLDEFILRDYGLQWLNSLPEGYMENTSYQGKIYALPFVKSHLYYYSREIPENLQTQTESITLKEIIELSSERNKAGIPVNVIIKDCLFSRELTAWKNGNSRDLYQMDTEYNKKLLYHLKEHRDKSLILYQDYEKEIEDFLAGKTDSIILEDSYENKIETEKCSGLKKYQLYITDTTPWILQGYNLFLVNKGTKNCYEDSWQLMKHMRDSYEKTEKQNELSEETFSLKRISSRYNTKIQLMADRMISEFLHGEREIDSMLGELQIQIEKIQGIRKQD